MPDRLPSLVVLVGFWIPPAVVGWAAAWSLLQSTRPSRTTMVYPLMAVFVLSYAAAWFFYNLGRMPPYIPGSTIDPTFAPPRAVAWLAVVSGVLVLPGSALACVLAFRWRARLHRR